MGSRRRHNIKYQDPDSHPPYNWIHSCVARRKPILSEDNIAKRLSWCLERRDWSLSKWRSVYWTDEKSFTQFRKGAHVRVWRRAGEEFHQDCLAGAVSKSASRMVWGGFSWRGLGPLVLHHGK